MQLGSSPYWFSHRKANVLYKLGHGRHVERPGFWLNSVNMWSTKPQMEMGPELLFFMYNSGCCWLTVCCLWSVKTQKPSSAVAGNEPLLLTNVTNDLQELSLLFLLNHFYFSFGGKFMKPAVTDQRIWWCSNTKQICVAWWQPHACECQKWINLYLQRHQGLNLIIIWSVFQWSFNHDDAVFYPKSQNVCRFVGHNSCRAPGVH